jgi:hypothetical protein
MVLVLLLDPQIYPFGRLASAGLGWVWRDSYGAFGHSGLMQYSMFWSPQTTIGRRTDDVR